MKRPSPQKVRPQFGRRYPGLPVKLRLVLHRVSHAFLLHRSGRVGYDQLLFQLRIAWLTPKRLPLLIRDLFVGRTPLTSVECGVLEALVIEELANRNLTSGIPPPLNERLSVKQELNHVA